MLRAIFQMKKPVRHEFLEALYRLTEGNPFFVEEVLKLLLTAGDIFFTGGSGTASPSSSCIFPAAFTTPFSSASAC